MNFQRKVVFLLLLSVFLVTSGGAKPARAAKTADPASPDIMGRIMPAPMMVVGTYDGQGRANFGLFDRGGVAASKPETHIALCMQRTAYTYKNIIARKALTINLPSEEYAAEADLFGSFSGVSGGDYPKYQDKLAVTGMNADRGKSADAPMIREFPVSMECELVSVETIDEDSLFDLLIVKVVKVWLDDRYVNDAGSVNPKPAGASGMVFYNPGRGDYYGYYGLGDYLGKPETLGGAYEEKISLDDEKGKSNGGCSGTSAGMAGLLIVLGGFLYKKSVKRFTL